MALFRKLFATRPEIVLRTYDPDDHSVLFASSEPLDGGEHEVGVTVGTHRMRGRVRVDSLQAGLYYGIFLEPQEARPHLAVLLPQPLSKQEKRGAQRFSRGLRVSSPQLPGFQAITQDLSVSGLKLKTSGPVAVGEEWEAQIEFDDETMSKIQVRCRAVWCRPEGEAFLVGATFVDVSKPVASRIALFIQELRRVEPGVITDLYKFD